MAHDTHGVLPQDMALFHLFQDIRRNTDRNAVIGRFRYAFPGISPEHLGPQRGTPRAPCPKAASLYGRRRMKGVTEIQQIVLMHGRVDLTDKTFPPHN